LKTIARGEVVGQDLQGLRGRVSYSVLSSVLVARLDCTSA